MFALKTGGDARVRPALATSSMWISGLPQSRTRNAHVPNSKPVLDFSCANFESLPCGFQSSSAKTELTTKNHAVPLI